MAAAMEWESGEQYLDRVNFLEWYLKREGFRSLSDLNNDEERRHKINSMAQCYSNVKFLNCVYDDDIMKVIEAFYEVNPQLRPVRPPVTIKRSTRSSLREPPRPPSDPYASRPRHSDATRSVQSIHQGRDAFYHNSDAPYRDRPYFERREAPYSLHAPSPPPPPEETRYTRQQQRPDYYGQREVISRRWTGS